MTRLLRESVRNWRTISSASIFPTWLNIALWNVGSVKVGIAVTGEVAIVEVVLLKERIYAVPVIVEIRQCAGGKNRFKDY